MSWSEEADGLAQRELDEPTVVSDVRVLLALDAGAGCCVRHVEVEEEGAHRLCDVPLVDGADVAPGRAGAEAEAEPAADDCAARRLATRELVQRGCSMSVRR